MDKISSWMENKEKIHTLLACLSSFEGTSYGNSKYAATSSFISCCFTLILAAYFFNQHIASYPFSQIFKNSFNIVRKKDFHHKCSFFNGFTHPLPPPPPPPPSSSPTCLPLHLANGQNLLSVTKVFC